MLALHLETAGGPTIVLRGDSLAHLRLLATDLLALQALRLGQGLRPDERLIESIAC